jgi:hypothetical protein
LRAQFGDERLTRLNLVLVERLALLAFGVLKSWQCTRPVAGRLSDTVANAEGKAIIGRILAVRNDRCRGKVNIP